MEAVDVEMSATDLDGGGLGLGSLHIEAFCVGIDKYAEGGLPLLTTCEHDARAVMAACRCNSDVLANPRDSREVLDAAESFSASLLLSMPDLAVVFVAGYGFWWGAKGDFCIIHTMQEEADWVLEGSPVVLERAQEYDTARGKLQSAQAKLAKSILVTEECPEKARQQDAQEKKLAVELAERELAERERELCRAHEDAFKGFREGLVARKHCVPLTELCSALSKASHGRKVLLLVDAHSAEGGRGFMPADGEDMALKALIPRNTTVWFSQTGNVLAYEEHSPFCSALLSEIQDVCGRGRTLQRSFLNITKTFLSSVKECKEHHNYQVPIGINTPIDTQMGEGLSQKAAELNVPLMEVLFGGGSAADTLLEKIGASHAKLLRACNKEFRKHLSDDFLQDQSATTSTRKTCPVWDTIESSFLSENPGFFDDGAGVGVAQTRLIRMATVFCNAITLEKRLFSQDEEMHDVQISTDQAGQEESPERITSENELSRMRATKQFYGRRSTRLQVFGCALRIGRRDIARMIMSNMKDNCTADELLDVLKNAVSNSSMWTEISTITQRRIISEILDTNKAILSSSGEYDLISGEYAAMCLTRNDMQMLDLLLSRMTAKTKVEILNKSLQCGINLGLEDRQLTPLAVACYLDKGGMVDFLLEQGADPNKTTASDSLPLRIASCMSRVWPLRLLLSAASRTGTQLAFVDEVFLDACRQNRLAVVQTFLQYEQVVGWLDAVAIRSLCISCEESHFAVSRVLLQCEGLRLRGGNLDQCAIEERTSWATPIPLSVFLFKSGQIQLVEQLLKFGASQEFLKDEQDSFFSEHCTSSEGVKLLEKVISPQRFQKIMEECLLGAVTSRQMATVETLLQAGARSFGLGDAVKDLDTFWMVPLLLKHSSPSAQSWLSAVKQLYDGLFRRHRASQTKMKFIESEDGRPLKLKLESGTQSFTGTMTGAPNSGYIGEVVGTVGGRYHYCDKGHVVLNGFYREHNLLTAKSASEKYMSDFCMTLPSQSSAGSGQDGLGSYWWDADSTGTNKFWKWEISSSNTNDGSRMVHDVIGQLFAFRASQAEANQDATISFADWCFLKRDWDLVLKMMSVHFPHEVTTARTSEAVQEAIQAKRWGHAIGFANLKVPYQALLPDGKTTVEHFFRAFLNKEVDFFSFAELVDHVSPDDVSEKDVTELVPTVVHQICSNAEGEIALVLADFAALLFLLRCKHRGSGRDMLGELMPLIDRLHSSNDLSASDMARLVLRLCHAQVWISQKLEKMDEMMRESEDRHALETDHAIVIEEVLRFPLFVSSSRHEKAILYQIRSLLREKVREGSMKPKLGDREFMAWIRSEHWDIARRFLSEELLSQRAPGAITPWFQAAHALGALQCFGFSMATLFDDTMLLLLKSLEKIPRCRRSFDCDENSNHDLDKAVALLCDSLPKPGYISQTLRDSVKAQACRGRLLPLIRKFLSVGSSLGLLLSKKVKEGDWEFVEILLGARKEQSFEVSRNKGKQSASFMRDTEFFSIVTCSLLMSEGSSVSDQIRIFIENPDVFLGHCNQQGSTTLTVASTWCGVDVVDHVLKSIQGIAHLRRHMQAPICDDIPQLKIPCDVSGLTSLHRASKRTDDDGFEIAKKLLEVGARVNQLDGMDESALMCACAAGSLKVVSLLLEHRACVTFANKTTKNTALHLAVTRGNADVVRQLISSGAQIAGQNARKETAFHLARSKEVVVQLLGEHETSFSQHPRHLSNVLLSLKTTDSEGHTPLNLACKQERGSIEVAHALLDALRAVFTSSHGHAVQEFEEPDKQGITPIVSMLRWDDQVSAASAVRKLVELGSNVNHRNHLGETAFHLARSKEVVVQLLGGDASGLTHRNNVLHALEATDGEGYTPLNLACKRGSVEIAHALLDALKACHEAFPGLTIQNFEPDIEEKTPMLNVLLWDDQVSAASAVRKLVELGSNVDYRNHLGETAFHLARSKEVVVQLLGDASDQTSHFAQDVTHRNNVLHALKATDREGYTPLNLACKRGSVEIAHALLDALKACREAFPGLTIQDFEHPPDIEGNTAMLNVLLWDDQVSAASAVRKLVELGSDVKNQNGVSPALGAYHRNNTAAVQHLLDAGAPRAGPLLEFSIELCLRAVASEPQTSFRDRKTVQFLELGSAPTECSASSPCFKCVWCEERMRKVGFTFAYPPESSKKLLDKRARADSDDEDEDLARPPKRWRVSECDSDSNYEDHARHKIHLFTDDAEMGEDSEHDREDDKSSSDEDEDDESGSDEEEEEEPEEEDEEESEEEEEESDGSAE